MPSAGGGGEEGVEGSEDGREEVVHVLRLHTRPYMDPVVPEEMSMYKRVLAELVRLLCESRGSALRISVLGVLVRMRPTVGLSSVLIRVAGMIGSARSRATNAGHDLEPALKREAISALAALAPVGYRRGLWQMLGALDDGHLEVRLSALEGIRCLAEVGDEEVIGVLLERLEEWCEAVAEGVSSSVRPRERTDPRLRQAVLHVLEKVMTTRDPRPETLDPRPWTLDT